MRTCELSIVTRWFGPTAPIVSGGMVTPLSARAWKLEPASRFPTGCATGAEGPDAALGSPEPSSDAGDAAPGDGPAGPISRGAGIGMRRGAGTAAIGASIPPPLAAASRAARSAKPAEPASGISTLAPVAAPARADASTVSAAQARIAKRTGPDDPARRPSRGRFRSATCSPRPRQATTAPRAGPSMAPRRSTGDPENAPRTRPRGTALREPSGGATRRERLPAWKRRRSGTGTRPPHEKPGDPPAADTDQRKSERPKLVIR